MRVVLAPDSFKGSIAATAAARAIAAGWRSVRPSDELVLIPQADGGEGTLDTIAAAVGGSRSVDAGTVTGPDGRPTPGSWLRLPDGTGVVELAKVSGLPLMDKAAPMSATTRGLGQVIAAALDAGVTSLMICLGGSASTDGGAGALTALGLVLLDGESRSVADGGGALAGVASVDWRALRPAPSGGVRLLTDVVAPLLGPEGAAAVYGPQKGATPAQIEVLESGLSNFAELMGPGSALAPGVGAAGGTAFGFVAAWSATLVAGAAEISRLTALDQAIARADVVITGEGRFDSTSARGKVVGNVLSMIPSEAQGIVIAGDIDWDPALLKPDIVGFSLRELAGSVEAAISDPSRWLARAGESAAILTSRKSSPTLAPRVSPDWARHH